MNEIEPNPGNYESEPKLDRGLIIDRLKYLGLDIERDDWVGLDDNEVLGDIASLAAEYDIDLDELLEASGTPVERHEDSTGCHDFGGEL